MILIPIRIALHAERPRPASWATDLALAAALIAAAAIAWLVPS